MKNQWTRWAKEPLIQFLLIGACIYAAYGWFGTAEDDAVDNTVIVDAARIQGFIAQWQQRWNRPPTRQELDGLINAYVREDILYRAAIEMGLDQDDPVTRRRMAQKLEFLTNDIALFKEPTPEELRQHFVDNQARYREPDLITFEQAFFDPDRREDSTLEDAAAALAQLQGGGVPEPGTLTVGDQTMLQSYFKESSELDVRRQMGSGFAETVMTLEAGRWHGPVLSGYGVHLVYVFEQHQAPPPVFEDVQQLVLESWQSEQQEAFNAQFFDSLKSRYEVVIAEVPAGAVLETPDRATMKNSTTANDASATNPAS